MKMNHEHVTMTVSGAPLEVTKLDADEELSTLFRYQVVCSDGGPVPARQRVGAAAVITLRDAYGSMRTVHGTVCSARRSMGDEDLETLVLEIRPAVFALSLGRDQRAFHDETTLSIAKQLLGDFDVRLEIADSYELRPYCVQYRESTWAFLTRLFEEEGIHYWFDHTGDATELVISDRNANDLSGGAHIEHRAGLGLQAERESIVSFGADARATFSACALHSFDSSRPDFDVRASAGEGDVEHYDAPGAGPLTPKRCQAKVERRLERAALERASFHGESTSVRLLPGRVFELDGHPLPRLDGRYLTIGTRIEVEQRNRGGSWSCSFRSTFRAIAAATRFRPAETAPPAQQIGIQSARVVGAAGQEIHTSQSGDVRVKMHWDRGASNDDSSGYWARVHQRNTAGSHLLPRVGWNVMVAYEEGSVALPRVVNRFYDASHPPPYALPASNASLTFKTATTPGDGTFNELKYSDIKGSEKIVMDASQDMTVRVNNVAMTRIGSNRKLTVANNREVAITAVASQDVAGPQAGTIAGNQSISVVAGRSKTIAGSEQESIGGSRQLDVGMGHSNTTAATRNLTVGGALMDITLGPISKSSDATATTLVGGAHALITPSTISESAEAVGSEIVGGARIDIASDNVVRSSQVAIAETAGGVMLLNSGAGYSHLAKAALSMTAGGVVSVDGTSVSIKAAAMLQLRCGGSSITITPSSVEFNSAAITIDGGVLSSTAPSIVHN